MNAARLPSTADVLLERIIYLVSEHIILKPGEKHPVLEVFRDKLIAPLCVENLDTVTRLLKVLASRGYIFRLAQHKDFESHKFGPVRLVPGARIWARIAAKVEELRARYRRHAEKAKKGKKAKNPSKNRPTFLQTISSLSENKEGRREKEKKRQRLKAQEDREIARLDLAAQNNGRADKIPASTALGRLLKTVVCRE